LQTEAKSKKWWWCNSLPKLCGQRSQSADC